MVVNSFTARPLYLRVKSPLYPLEGLYLTLFLVATANETLQLEV